MQNWVKIILRDVLFSREVVMGEGIVGILNGPFSFPEPASPETSGRETGSSGALGASISK